MKLPPLFDWDDAFANMKHVEKSEELPSFWSARAAAYREELRAGGQRLETNIGYGTHSREKFDLVWPDSTPKGLAVFIHGGFWMRLNKDFWTDFAEGARAQGWAVCVPSYTLAPEARIHEITAQVGNAITVAAHLVDGPIRLSGHSAGGHLATRMLCSDSPLSENVFERIDHTLSISGVHDLRPLLHTEMNETLKLDLEEARAESAVLAQPAAATPLTCWVGGGERPEFIRQTRLLSDMWAGLDVPVRCEIEDDHNHFTVLEGLKDPGSPITTAFIGPFAQAENGTETVRA